MLPRHLDPQGLLPVLPAGVDRGYPDGGADLGRNGTYLVLRTLAQDVDAFDAYVHARRRRSWGWTPSCWPRRWWAAGAGGASLVQSPDADRADLATANDFGYHHDDARGLRCPLGAHVRRANPRDSLDPRPGSDASQAVTDRHRLLRRGRVFADDGQQGLQFVALNANLGRQFEFVQHSWLNDPKFAGLTTDLDPLVTPRTPDGVFTIPDQPFRTRVRVCRSSSPRWAGRTSSCPDCRALQLSGGWGLPDGGVVVKLDRFVNDVLVRVFWVARRIDPLIRPLINVAVRPWLQALVQWHVRRRLPDHGLALAEERELPGEAAATASIIAAMTRFTETTYAHAMPNGPATRRRTGSRGPSSPWPTTCPSTCGTGCSPEPATYRAFVRFAGPGPTAPPDLHDNAIMSIGVKVLGVAGPKLLDEESSTQDLLGISAPTFTTPDVVQNAILQQEIGNPHRCSTSSGPRTRTWRT